MKYVLTEKQIEIIEESWKKEEDPIANHIRKCLKDVYKPLGLWGSIQDPDNNCETGEGVIKTYTHLPGEDEWSILNRFDTNTKVRDRIKELFLIENPGKEITIKTLTEFIETNKQKLFNGEYTNELVELNKKTIESGNRNEKFAIDVLLKYFGDKATVKRFCSGDIRDTKKGMDISVDVNGVKFHIQVKPYETIKSYIDEEEGETYFQVKTYLNPSKYSEKNVDILFLVNFDKGEYVLFSNQKKYIKPGSANTIKFYEPYLLTNITFDSSVKQRKSKIKTKQDTVKNLFDINSKRLQNLQFKKEAIEKLIQKELERIEKLNQSTENLQ